MTYTFKSFHKMFRIVHFGEHGIGRSIGFSGLLMVSILLPWIFQLKWKNFIFRHYVISSGSHLPGNKVRRWPQGPKS